MTETFTTCQGEGNIDNSTKADLIYRYEPGSAEPQSCIHVSTFLNEINKTCEEYAPLLYTLLFPEVVERDGVFYAVNMDLIRNLLERKG